MKIANPFWILNINCLVLFVICSLLFVVSGCSPQLSRNKPQVTQTERVYITVDMCQSSKPYAKRLFVFLDQLGHKLGKPVPVAVCVAGGWIQRHEKELKAIQRMYLDISWVNHSFTHPVSDDFLNNPKVDFTREVMANVALMRNHHLKVSKYFRFPGLRHNSKRLVELKVLGYTNLDADAWLAKGEKIKEGSIILVHGNGNEPKGVELLLDYLKANESNLLNGRLEIKPLVK